MKDKNNDVVQLSLILKKKKLHNFFKNNIIV